MNDYLVKVGPKWNVRGWMMQAKSPKDAVKLCVKEGHIVPTVWPETCYVLRINSDCPYPLSADCRLDRWISGYAINVKVRASGRGILYRSITGLPSFTWPEWA